MNTQVYLQYKGFYKGTISLLTWMMNFLYRWENATDNRLLMLREALINSTNEMKCEAHGTQQPRHINLIGEGVSTAQRSN